MYHFPVPSFGGFRVRRANLARFCGDDESRLRPACVQTGREDGGQCLKMWQIHARAEAPRQSRKEREPGPASVRLSNWIWLRTESIDGIPVTPNHTHVWFMCGTDGANGSPSGQKVSVFDRCPEPAANGSGLHPGKRYSLSLEKEQPGTWEICLINECNLPADGMEVGGVIVVRERESRSHGEGHQPVAIGTEQRRRPEEISWNLSISK